MKNKPEAEELLFYFDKERDAALGTIGHLRIDFGRSGEEFNCTWFDHANSGKNDSYFKERFDMFIDDLRTGVLKSKPKCVNSATEKTNAGTVILIRRTVGASGFCRTGTHIISAVRRGQATMSAIFTLTIKSI